MSRVTAEGARRNVTTTLFPAPHPLLLLAAEDGLEEGVVVVVVAEGEEGELGETWDSDSRASSTSFTLLSSLALYTSIVIATEGGGYGWKKSDVFGLVGGWVGG